MIHRWITVLLLTSCATSIAEEASKPAISTKEMPDRAVFKKFVELHCLSCHEDSTRKGGLALDSLIDADIGQNAKVWEGVVRKLTARQMPPRPSVRPREQDYEAVVSWLETSLDAAAAKSPNPGRTETFRRLNRTEYHNTIRDLLGLDVDVATLIPADESSHGFDNITVADLSPMLLN